jgi:prepilin signal peptidase PulO-like enzyme (type II secretory pathway)
MSEVIVALGYVGPLGAIAAYDVRTLRAPNRYLYPLIGLALVFSMTVHRADAREALLGGLLAFSLLFALAIIGRGALGFGGVKYGLMCGIVVRVHGVMPMLAFAFVTGAAVALLVLATRVRRRSDVVAFTPFLFAGTLFALVWSQSYLLRS